MLAPSDVSGAPLLLGELPDCDPPAHAATSTSTQKTTGTRKNGPACSMGQPSSGAESVFDLEPTVPLLVFLDASTPCAPCCNRVSNGLDRHGECRHTALARSVRSGGNRLVGGRAQISPDSPRHSSHGLARKVAKSGPRRSVLLCRQIER